MSIFKYNGVIIPYSYTTAFSQEPVYDDYCNTDWVCNKYDITVQGLLHYKYAALIDPTLANAPSITNPADFMNTIREKLLQPRRTLSMKFNDVELIPQSAVAGTVDAMNGPKPQFCRLTALTSTSYMIEYRIVAHYVENFNINTGSSPVATNQTGGSILYNRWSESVSINNLNLSSRTRTGKYKIRSDNYEGKICDELRSRLAVVGIPNGFVRKSSRYTVSPDGLTLDYEVEDQEVFKMPPPPAIEAEGNYRESINKMGALRWGEATVTLRGDKITPQENLIDQAVGIVSQKINERVKAIAANTKTNQLFIPESAILTVDLYRNEITFTMRAIIGQSNQQVDGTGTGATPIAAFALVDTFTPESDGVKYAPSYPDRGTAGLLLQAASYYDPTLRGVGVVRRTGQMNQGIEVGLAGINPET